MDARVADYRSRLKSIALAELQDKQIVDVFWETDSGRLLFHYKAPVVSKTGRTSKRWHEFALLFSNDDMEISLKEKGCSPDNFIFYIGKLVDSFMLDYSEVMCAHPFGEFGIVPDRYMIDPPNYIRKDSLFMDDYDWLDDYACDQGFISALAEDILAK
jgi:hypothetical protein